MAAGSGTGALGGRGGLLEGRSFGGRSAWSPGAERADGRCREAEGRIATAGCGERRLGRVLGVLLLGEQPCLRVGRLLLRGERLGLFWAASCAARSFAAAAAFAAAAFAFAAAAAFGRPGGGLLRLQLGERLLLRGGEDRRLLGRDLRRGRRRRGGGSC